MNSNILQDDRDTNSEINVALEQIKKTEILTFIPNSLNIAYKY